MTPINTLRALLKADPALAERLLRVAEPAPEHNVRTGADIAAVVRPLLAGRENEALAAVALDRKHRVIAVDIMTTGSDAFTIVDPKQILRWALTRKRAVSAIALAHNHPSGDPTPSAEDRAVTTRVREACNAVGVRFLDHVVIGDPDRWFSIEAGGGS